MSFLYSGNILILHTDGVLCYAQKGDILELISELTNLTSNEMNSLKSIETLDVRWFTAPDSTRQTLLYWHNFMEEIMKFHTTSSYNRMVINRLYHASHETIQKFITFVNNDRKFHELLLQERSSNKSLKHKLHVAMQINSNAQVSEDNFREIQEILQARAKQYEEIDYNINLALGL